MQHQNISSTLGVHRYDVIIIGGGSAGVAAAVASARIGARTLLVERNHCLGGAATMRNVSTYCGFYTLGEEPKLVVGGVGQEVLHLLKERNAVTEPLRHRGVYVVFDPENVKIVLDTLCSSAGVDIRFGATMVDAQVLDKSMHEVTIADGSGMQQYQARSLIDCSGDGALLSAIGAAARYGNNGEVNLGTLGTRFGGIPDSIELSADKIAQAVEHYRLKFQSDDPAAILPVSKDRSVVVRLPISGDAVCYLASESYDPRDSHSVTRAELSGREQAWVYLDIIKTIPGCENAYLVSTGPEFGTRESLHLVGKRQLTWSDISDRKQFNDCIALGAWGAEWHRRDDFASTFEYPVGKAAYQIPLSCLVSQNIERVFAAGRLADGDRLAGASIRVMGTAFATGQAAGVAAALVADYCEETAPEAETANAADILRIQHELRAQGAIIDSDQTL